MRPTKDRVIAKCEDVTEQAQEAYGGALIIPDTGHTSNDQEYRVGVVTAVGPGTREGRKPPVEVGDRVLWRKFTGVQARLDGVDYVVLEHDEVMGVVS